MQRNGKRFFAERITYDSIYTGQNDRTRYGSGPQGYVPAGTVNCFKGPGGKAV